MASATSTILVASVLTVLLSNARLASATPSTSFSDTIFRTPNVTGGPVDEIKCYALPYGAIGIISHLLTFWTIAWMSVGKSPLWPFFDMNKYKFDMFLACIALCTCIPIASITMHRCRLSWHFLLICVWKLITSVSLACITLHRCIIIRRQTEAETSDTDMELPRRNGYEPTQTDEPYHHGMYAQNNDRSGFFSEIQVETNTDRTKKQLAPLWWLVLYLSGTIVGMVGLCSLLWTTFRKDATIRHLTYGFGAAMAIIPILVAIFWYVHHLDKMDKNKGGSRACMSAFGQTLGGGFVAFIAVFGVFSSLYSDLVLGSIANNLFGMPSDDFAPLYWAWFVAKRLPLLSL
ncbi:hypothetical protein DE146DRAFT_286036 [Phaeosphaeria sp. MPI-PUGE-AT-0046c]|nr:hypothetical protein DE146DRAFT_286036 [Phaeosphaeria sp. MPI-PUGE-AT-0046c]